MAADARHVVGDPSKEMVVMDACYCSQCHGCPLTSHVSLVILRPLSSLIYIWIPHSVERCSSTMLFHAALALVSMAAGLATATDEPPTCTDGGTLYCCQATFAGDLPLVVSLSNITGYNLTPEDVNCLGSESSLFLRPAAGTDETPSQRARPARERLRRRLHLLPGHRLCSHCRSLLLQAARRLRWRQGKLHKRPRRLPRPSVKKSSASFSVHLLPRGGSAFLGPSRARDH